MKNTYNSKQNLKIVVLALLTVVLLCIAIVTMILHIYHTSEEEAYERLHLETQQIKRDINLQVYSDRENLMTMANFAEKLYENGEEYELLFKSFEEIGLFEDVRILEPNNILLTKMGTKRVESDISFKEEVKKGMYVSGRVRDLINKDREVVRSSVPVKTDTGETVAIIYGIIDLQKFEDRYVDDVRAINSDLFIIEQKNGNFIIDTKREGLGQITEIADTSFRDNYSYEELVQNISAGKNGFTAFDSIVNGKKLYVHYAPLEFADWSIMVAKPASEVLGTARKTGLYMLVMALVIFIIMLLYVLILVWETRNNLSVSYNVSIIRKSLLEINQNIEKVKDALKIMTEFSKARSSLFVDFYGEEHIYISPNYQNDLIEGEERAYFISELLTYITKNQSKCGTNILLTHIKTNSAFSHEMPEFCEFLRKHGVLSLHVASVTHNTGNARLLCVLNAKSKYTGVILKDIAVCFSMAVYNKRHLANTESMALTDALTGVANRMAYKQDIKNFTEKDFERFSCIYIDVNELNYFNNTHGHAAGDQMLIYIAKTLMKEFKDSRVYRMGGDEFLIFASGISRLEVTERLNRATASIEEMKYHISVGIKKKTEDLTIEDLVNEAEKRMYVEKSKYYQKKDSAGNAVDNTENGVMAVHTGLRIADAYLEVLQNKHHGVYYVSLDDDFAQCILAPSEYFELSDREYKFSDIIKKYFHDWAKPEFYRTFISFMQYDAIKEQLSAGQIPKLAYVKKTGKKIILSVWPVRKEATGKYDTIWIFEEV